jgi:voltage-gated sodium channel
VSFIFLTAFAFLNMVIGIVVNVLEEEHERERQLDPDEVTLKDLKLEIAELKELLEKQRG